MYPKSYFDLFQPRDLINEIFIICAFDDETKKYCDDIICPAIESDKHGHSLKPYRVDYSVCSEDQSTYDFIGETIRKSNLS